MIISIHIRKCAGTTFRECLTQYFGDNVLFDYGDEIGSSWPSTVAKRRIRLEQAIQKKDEITEAFKVVHGHFFRTKYDFLDAPKTYITFLRDPVQRVLSNYYYLKRNFDRRNPDAFVVNSLGFSIAEFARYSDNRNLQSQYIQATSLDDFEFVGIVEQYEKSIAHLNCTLGCKLPITESLNTNITVVEDGGYMVDEKTRSIIENCNRDDLRLYDIARTRIEGRTCHG